MKDFLKFIFFGTTKAPKLRLIDSDTGEKLDMEVGFSLQILLLGSFFGLPLFFKRLWGWAWSLFFLSTVQFVFFYRMVNRILSARTVAEYEAVMRRAVDPVETAVGYLLVAIVVLLSIKANRWAVERLLKKGWRFEDVSAPLVRQVAAKWKLSKHYLKPFEKREKL